MRWRKRLHKYTEDDHKMVSINSVCFNKSCSMLTAKLEAFIGNNNMVIPYEIDTGSDRNIMPCHIFQKIIPRGNRVSACKNHKKHIKLKTYNKMFMTQLGTCTVAMEYKNNRKKCEFFVVPSNGHVLLGMPDTGSS